MRQRGYIACDALRKPALSSNTKFIACNPHASGLNFTRVVVKRRDSSATCVPIRELGIATGRDGVGSGTLGWLPISDYGTDMWWIF
jgi:hypothetical protein